MTRAVRRPLEFSGTRDRPALQRRAPETNRGVFFTFSHQSYKNSLGWLRSITKLSPTDW
jgi:hypothetical protein